MVHLLAIVTAAAVGLECVSGLAIPVSEYNLVARNLADSDGYSLSQRELLEFVARAGDGKDAGKSDGGKAPASPASPPLAVKSDKTGRGPGRRAGHQDLAAAAAANNRAIMGELFSPQRPYNGGAPPLAGPARPPAQGNNGQGNGQGGQGSQGRRELLEFFARSGDGKDAGKSGGGNAPSTSAPPLAVFSDPSRRVGAGRRTGYTPSAIPGTRVFGPVPPSQQQQTNTHNAASKDGK